MLSTVRDSDQRIHAWHWRSQLAAPSLLSLEIVFYLKPILRKKTKATDSEYRRERYAK